MTDTVRYPLVLGLISLCSAAGLAFSYALTRDEIRRQQLLERDRGLAAVFGIEFDENDPERPWHQVSAPAAPDRNAPPPVFAATDPKTGRTLFAAMGSARGYSSKIEVIVAIDPGKGGPDAARIRAMKVVRQNDTPGLGNRCQEPAFQRQFEGLLLGRLELKKGVPYRQPGSDQPIAAITGATITSNAVLKAVRRAVERVRQCTAEASKPGKPRKGTGGQ